MTLGNFQRIFPSRQDVAGTFLVCVSFVYFWSIILMLYRIPSSILYYGVWDLVSTIAYTLSFALFESFLVCLVLVVLSAILPSGLYRLKFLPLSTMVILVTIFWAAVYHLFFEPLYSLIGIWAHLWVGLYLLNLAMAVYLVHQRARVASLMAAIANRITVLSYLYLFSGLVSAVMVAIRNL
jgi:hypothetical protein